MVDQYIKEKIFPAISTTHEDILGFFYGEFIIIPVSTDITV